MKSKLEQGKIKVWTQLLAFASFLLLLNACDHAEVPARPLSISFYHWQQRLNPDSLNHRLLEMSEKPELFTKVFDLVWADEKAEPRAVLDVSGHSTLYQLQPVVFVTNEVMLELGKSPDTDQRLEQLADDLLGLIKRRLEGQIPFSELQIDCDWTRGSAKTYFKFLEMIQARLGDSIRLAATVRLHQWRDYETQGVPPVDRGILMAYNSGDLNRWETENSILDTAVSATYLPARPGYPLPLDLALPLYRWAAIYRRGELAYLINDLGEEALQDSSRFEAINEHRFQVKEGTYLQAVYCYPDDLIRLENSDTHRLMTTARQLGIVPRFTGQRLLFYRQGGRVAETVDTAFLRELAQ